MGSLLRQAGAPDLEASELFIRSSVHEVGGKLLERVLNHDGGAAGASVKCGAGHAVAFVDYRSKELTTVLGTIRLRRGYYYCGECGKGVLPRDEQLDIVGTSFSPGVRRMMGRMGGKESFNEARDDIAENAGIKLETKSVERVAEAIGSQVEILGQRERLQAMTEKVVALKSVAKLYISIDGTGVPVVKRETAGRRGTRNPRLIY